MKMKYMLMVWLVFTQVLTVSHAAAPAHCYGYMTELVRSSNFPFSEWTVTPGQVNLIIDDDDDAIIRAKLVMEAEGSGTIGWVIFDKHTRNLYNATANLEKTEALKFNEEYAKAWQFCLTGEVVYQVNSKGRLYLYHIEKGKAYKTSTFVITGDYLQLHDKKNGYSYISYQTKSGNKVYSWVTSGSLRKVDFKNNG